jgi:hypothetical protein
MPAAEIARSSQRSSSCPSRWNSRASTWYKSHLPGPLAPLLSLAKLGRTPVRDSLLAFGLNGLSSGSSSVIEGMYSKRSTLFVHSNSAPLSLFLFSLCSLPMHTDGRGRCNQKNKSAAKIWASNIIPLLYLETEGDILLTLNITKR